MNKSALWKLCCFALAGQVLLPAVTAAQSTTPAPQKPSGVQLDEIVVTAEKRSSTIQDTAISMSALSADQLQQQGITGVTGIIAAVPGLSMRTSGPGQTELEMRGLSSSGGASPTVGFYLDDYPLTAPAAALVGKVVIDPDLYDVDRVEVLRGPQGTLYGSGSMGGTVKLITSAPKLNVFEGSVDVTGSGTSGGGFNRGVNVAVNVPLVDDKLALRLVGTDKFRDGWITRTVEPNFPAPVNPGPCGPGWPGCTRGDVQGTPSSQTKPRINWERLEGGRAELLAQPNADLDIHAMVVYQKINMGGYDEYDAPPGLTNMHFQPNNNQEPISDEFKLYGLTANYNLGFATATSATAYYTRVESQTQDVTEALYSLVPLYGFPVNQLFNSPFNETDTTQQFSEELRLASSGDGPLQWIGGVFYSQFKSIFAENNNSQALVATIPGALDSNQAGILYQAHNPYHIKQYAVFGETTYSFLDNWKITGGLRWFDFQSHAIEETSGLLATSGNASQLVNVFNTSNSGLNPKVTLSYEQNHDLTVYGTVAKGFRPGGINQQIPNPPCSLNGETFGPDSIWNYELGEKAKLLDNRLVVNADVYYISWSKVQQSINQACGYPLSVNAGNAASYGPELEISAILSPNWKITASGTFTHADLTSTNAALAAAGATFAPGGALLNVPKYTETTSLTYNRPINDDISFMARISNSYVGPSTDVDFTYASLPTYDLVGLRMGVETDRWSATLFADNLTDKRAVLGINTTGFSYTIPSLIRVATNQPRTIGANLKYRF